jgi:hypothetical protein
VDSLSSFGLKSEDTAMPHGDDASIDLILSLLKDAKPVPCSPYLEPEDSRFSLAPGMRVYEQMLAESLLEAAEREAQSLAPAWQREEKASLVCLPSFEPEWALWVVGERKAGFWVLLTEAEKTIWYSTTNNPERPRPPSVKIHRSELATDLGRAVCDIWSRVLSQTRYPREPLQGACDGVTYHFAYSRKWIKETAGKTWSPEEETVPGKLVGLSHALRDYAKDSANQDVFLKVIQDHLEWFQTHSQQFSS